MRSCPVRHMLRVIWLVTLWHLELQVYDSFQKPLLRLLHRRRKDSTVSYEESSYNDRSKKTTFRYFVLKNFYPKSFLISSSEVYDLRLKGSLVGVGFCSFRYPPEYRMSLIVDWDRTRWVVKLYVLYIGMTWVGWSCVTTWLHTIWLPYDYVPHD